MKPFTLFERRTGRIIMSGTTEVLPSTTAEQGILECLSQPHTQMVVAGKVVDMPKRPSEHHRFDWSTKVWALDAEKAWAAVRATRDRRLAESDWTTLPDVPLTDAQRAAWRAYRQALRDVTQQTDPLNICWPDRPQP
jgi:hypothetical protein